MVLREGKCINGKPEGEFKIYNDAGKLNRKVNFKNGLPHGSNYFYSKDGEITLTEVYESGKFVKEIKGKEEVGKSE